MNKPVFRGVKNVVKVWVNVKVSQGQSENGRPKYERVRFWIKFQKPDKPELDDFYERFEADSKEATLDLDRRMRELAIDWGLVEDVEGNPVEFSRENLDVMLENIDYYTGVMDAFGFVIGGSATKKT